MNPYAGLVPAGILLMPKNYCRSASLRCRPAASGVGIQKTQPLSPDLFFVEPRRTREICEGKLGRLARPAIVGRPWARLNSAESQR